MRCLPGLAMGVLRRTRERKRARQRGVSAIVMVTGRARCLGRLARSRMARLRATAPAARSVLDGREHDGMLGHVGKPVRSRTKQNIKK